MTGVIHLAASAVTVDGEAGQVRFDNGGAVTVGATGRITGIEGVAIRNAAGDLEVTLQARADETPSDAAGRIGDRGVIYNPNGSMKFCYAPAGGGEECASGPAPSVPLGAFDLALLDEGGGAYRLDYGYAPRARVYEALPSVLLGLNGLPTHRDRLSAPRSSNGAWAWARVEAEGGAREAKRSTSTTALSYDYRRYGVQTGVDVPLSASGLAGVSVHHRRGSAELSGRDGEIEASGTGFGVSGAWGFGDGLYVDGQVSATLYTADLKVPGASLGARGFGYAVGLETGRRLVLGSATLTPRVRLMHSQVGLKDFTDGVGSVVSLEKGRSVTGRAGAGVETAPSGLGGGRLFGSIDVEREFASATRVRVSGAELSSEAAATRLRMEVGGVHEWGDGRYAVQGVANYAASRHGDRGYGGGVSLKLRF